uniref:Uncharacterized protein n=1 Tax=Rhizophagus irregularis (strain DAOM 181602 / DAOM 197198 / MUCL 43194) TaxID=747089 RepID=U9T4Q3_RHIID
MTIRTIRRHRSASEDAINNPDLCYENVARFKRLLDVLNYKGSVAAMTDCTKLKTGLQYLSKLGCIVRSTLNYSDCKIKTYDNIYNTVSNIKNKNAITKDVKIYILQVPLLKFLPIVVALIPTRNNNAEKVFAFHQKLINIATRLDIHIISIGLDGAATEFQAQNLLQATKTNMRIQHRNIQFARNAAMSGARLLTFGNSTVRFDQLLKLSLKEDSYDFNEYGEINLIDDNLECLRYWLSDTEIDNAIKVEDFWDDNSKFRYTDNNEKINNDNLNISQSINCAVSKLSNQENQEELNSSDLDVSSLLKKNYGTCQVIVEHIQKLPDILWYPNYSKDFDYPLNNRLLNIEHFLNLRQHHDAYLNRKLECKNILLKNYNNETDGEFDINK